MAGCVVIRPEYVPVPARRRLVPVDVGRAALIQAAHQAHVAERAADTRQEPTP